MGVERGVNFSSTFFVGGEKKICKHVIKLINIPVWCFEEEYEWDNC